jgi:hypothetical protein
MWLEPQRLSALEFCSKFWDSMLSAPPGSHRLAAIPYAATGAAAPANRASLKEPERPRLSAAGRAKEQAPTATIWKLLQAQADLDLDVSEADCGSGHFSRNSATRSQSRNADAWQIILKDSRHRYLGTAGKPQLADAHSRVFSRDVPPISEVHRRFIDRTTNRGACGRQAGRCFLAVLAVVAGRGFNRPKRLRVVSSAAQTIGSKSISSA